MSSCTAVTCVSAGQRTADAILEESFRVARDVARERMGGKKSSGVSPSNCLTQMYLSKVPFFVSFLPQKLVLVVSLQV